MKVCFWLSSSLIVAYVLYAPAISTTLISPLLFVSDTTAYCRILPSTLNHHIWDTLFKLFRHKPLQLIAEYYLHWTPACIQDIVKILHVTDFTYSCKTKNFILFHHRVGCPQFTFPSYKPSHSLFFPQEAINSHPRYR